MVEPLRGLNTGAGRSTGAGQSTGQVSKCEISRDPSAVRIRRANVESKEICKQNQKGKCESAKINLNTGSEELMLDQQRFICKQDQSKCEISEDQSTNRIRRATVRTTTINLQTGSEEQM
jgi:hypothetical protein